MRTVPVLTKPVLRRDLATSPARLFAVTSGPGVIALVAVMVAVAACGVNERPDVQETQDAAETIPDPPALAELRDTVSLEELRARADRGDAVAQYSLGVAFEAGRGVPQDVAEAVRWFRLAADQGLATAQSNLGVAYATGRGVPRNTVEAVRWYRLAAEQGFATAQVNLGAMYADGDGVSQDDAEALRWYRLAAEQGDADAQFSLALMYANGRGVQPGDVEAYVWFSLAAAQASGENRDRYVEARDGFAEFLTAEQLADAQRRAREWTLTREP